MKLDEDAPVTSVHPTEGQAIASVYELIQEPGETEIIVHDSDGGSRSSMRIRRYGPLDDTAARADAMRITPSTARLRAGIASRLPVEGADLY